MPRTHFADKLHLRPRIPLVVRHTPPLLIFSRICSTAAAVSELRFNGLSAYFGEVIQLTFRNEPENTRARRCFGRSQQQNCSNFEEQSRCCCPFIVPCSSASVTFGARGIGSPTVRLSCYRSVICLLGSLPFPSVPKVKQADGGQTGWKWSHFDKFAGCCPKLCAAAPSSRDSDCMSALRSRSANPNSPNQLITSSKFSITSIAITMH